MSKRCMGCMNEYSGTYNVCPHCGYVEGTPAEEAIHIVPGTLLEKGHYIVGKVIGYGGFGVTYIGWDNVLLQKVAIKEYLPSDFSTRMPGQSRVTIFNGDRSEQFYDGMKKFIEEAKHLAKFQSEEGIVRVYDAFQENDTAYIVMEYLEGETLKARLDREKTIPETEAIRLLLPLLKSLQAVHREGIIHRDIAPDNIYLTNDGTAKLIDFGASRYATTSHSRSLTTIVKPGFSPEEQYRSRGDQGPHTDVYAIGATMYCMLTGEVPPNSMDRSSIAATTGKDPLVKPQKIKKNISTTTSNAILNALNVQIEDRTPDIETFRKELTGDKPAILKKSHIKRVDFFSWPAWAKILVPVGFVAVICFGILTLLGVIGSSSFKDEIVIPSGMVTVPNVEGMNRDDAVKALADVTLNVSLESNVESEYIEAGKILLQEPIAGSSLIQNSIVSLTISRGSDSELLPGTVPVLDALTKQEAIERLLNNGFGEPIIEEAPDDIVPEGQVCKQSIPAGEHVESGTVLTITISTGPKPFEIPNVVGKPLKDADELLKQLGLIVEHESAQSDQVAKGNIISQNVAPGEMVKKGDTVILTVCSDKATLQVPNVIGMSQSVAKTTLETNGFSVSVTESYSNDVASGSVISQSPANGSTQAKGSVVTINISKGKQVTQPTTPNVQSITVFFNAAGGSIGTSSKTVNVSEKYGTLPVPTKDMCSFDGWYTSENGGVLVDANTTVSTTSAHTLYAHWSNNAFSDWSTELPDEVSANSSNYVIEKRTEYQYCTRSTTTSNSSELSGWKQTGRTVIGWTNWSGWQNDRVSPSESREVETQIIPAVTKTVYCYERWYGYDPDDKIYYTSYGNGYWKDYESYECDSPLPKGDIFDKTHQSYRGPQNNIGNPLWWNERTKTVTVTSEYTQYRYRDAQYQYSFEQWSDWSSWQTTRVDENSNTQVRTRVVSRYMKR